MCLSNPGRIVQIYQRPHYVEADIQVGMTLVSHVSLRLCPEAQVGDTCLVHTGEVLQLIDEQKAEKIIVQMQMCGIA